MRYLIILLCLFPLLGFAELPPSAYEKMQASAPEFIQIEVLRVDISPGDKPEEQSVHVVAMVTKVMRTATELKSDEIINIVYTVTERPKGWTGPGSIPLLQEKQETVAYLSKLENGDFKPEAGRMSFKNF